MTKTVYKFYADWCGPCKTFKPVVKSVFMRRNDISLIEIDVDTNPMEAFNYQITSVPALVFLIDGIHIKTIRGAVTEKELQEEVNLIFGGGS